MEPEGSLPCSHKPATGSYPEPAESSSPHRSLSKVHLNVILPPFLNNQIWRLLFVLCNMRRRGANMGDTHRCFIGPWIITRSENNVTSDRSNDADGCDGVINPPRSEFHNDFWVTDYSDDTHTHTKWRCSHPANGITSATTARRTEYDIQESKVGAV